MFRIESCAKQQVCIDDLSEERASAQIQIEQHSDFRWLRAKAWKQCQTWFWINSNQRLQLNQSQMKCDVWKPNIAFHLRLMWPTFTRRASIFDLKIFEQSSCVNIHLLCYWPTIHNSISKICPQFQVISSHFFAIRGINQRFAFKNSRISCLALIFNLKIPSTTVLYTKKSVAGGEIRRVIYRFFRLIDTNQWLSVPLYLCQWAPAACPGFLRFPFRPVGA